MRRRYHLAITHDCCQSQIICETLKGCGKLHYVNQWRG